MPLRCTRVTFSPVIRPLPPHTRDRTVRLARVPTQVAALSDASSRCCTDRQRCTFRQTGELAAAVRDRTVRLVASQRRHGAADPSRDMKAGSPASPFSPDGRMLRFGGGRRRRPAVAAQTRVPRCYESSGMPAGSVASPGSPDGRAFASGAWIRLVRLAARLRDYAAESPGT